MNRGLLLAVGIALFLSPGAGLAQRHGGRNAGAAGRAATGVPDKDDLKDFKKAVALQATPDQVTQFRQLHEAVEVAQKESQALLQIAGQPDKTGSVQHDLIQHAAPLSDAVDDMRKNSGIFVGTFSAAQKSGLKDATKKLLKSNSEVIKSSQAVSQALDRTQIEPQQVATCAEKLQRALGAFQSFQLAVGNEMGIQDEKTTAQGNTNSARASAPQ